LWLKAASGFILNCIESNSFDVKALQNELVAGHYQKNVVPF
jgi:hypothetical protein